MNELKMAYQKHIEAQILACDARRAWLEIVLAECHGKATTFGENLRAVSLAEAANEEAQAAVEQYRATQIAYVRSLASNG